MTAFDNSGFSIRDRALILKSYDALKKYLKNHPNKILGHLKAFKRHLVLVPLFSYQLSFQIRVLLKTFSGEAEKVILRFWDDNSEIHKFADLSQVMTFIKNIFCTEIQASSLILLYNKLTLKPHDTKYRTFLFEKLEAFLNLKNLESIPVVPPNSQSPFFATFKFDFQVEVSSQESFFSSLAKVLPAIYNVKHLEAFCINQEATASTMKILPNQSVKSEAPAKRLKQFFMVMPPHP